MWPLATPKHRHRNDPLRHGGTPQRLVSRALRFHGVWLACLWQDGNRSNASSVPIKQVIDKEANNPRWDFATSTHYPLF